jgi:hypothetical protein
MIAKDFHSAKDFRQIRGKSFAIMGGVTTSAGLSGHTGQVITRRRSLASPRAKAGA